MRKAIFRIEVIHQFKWIDMENKIYNEIFRRSIYLFSIRIYHRDYDVTHEVDSENTTKKMGFIK
jgi:hypothetical protein